MLLSLDWFYSKDSPQVFWHVYFRVIGLLSGCLFRRKLSDHFPGQYWIDPNGGDINDAIIVHCDMETGSSCVFPKPMTSQDIKYEGNEHEPWLSEMDDGFTVSSSGFKAGRPRRLPGALVTGGCRDLQGSAHAS